MQGSNLLSAVHQNLANQVTALCTELRRVDDLIEQMRWAVNACQKPGDGKIAVLRERAREPLKWLHGAPRLGEMYWVRSGVFLTKKIPATHLTKRAKSSGSFGMSYEIMVENLRVLDELLKFRGELLRKFTEIQKHLRDIEGYALTIDDLQGEVDNLYSHSRDIWNSKFTITARDLGYTGKS